MPLSFQWNKSFWTRIQNFDVGAKKFGCLEPEIWVVALQPCCKPLEMLHGPLGAHGSLVENHCFKAGLLKLWVVSLWHQTGSRNVILASQTNWLDKSDLKGFVIFTKKLKVGLQWIYFYYIFRGNTVLHAVSCLLGCLPVLWNDNNWPSTTCYVLLRHDFF